MSPEEVLRRVAGALVESDGTASRSFSPRVLASALGVGEHHIHSALRGLRDRGLITLGMQNSIAFTRAQGTELQCIATPLTGAVSADDVSRLVGIDVLKRMRAREDFTLNEVALSSGIKVGNVRRIVASWNNYLTSDAFFVTGGDGLDWTADGLEFLEAEIEQQLSWPAAASVQVHHGDMVSGSKVSTHVTGSTVGSVSSGTHFTSDGTVSDNVGAIQDELRATLREARKALIDDEDRVDAALHDTLAQFLRIAKDIDVEVKSLAESQAAAKTILDDIWVKESARGFKSSKLPVDSALLKLLAMSPVMAQVVESLT